MRGPGSHWGWTTSRNNPTVVNANQVRLRGRHLLDHEALTCLLVLLFVDEPKLNTLRLHRVLRNLCYYGPTRIWIINTLLSVLQRTNLDELSSDALAPELKISVPSIKDKGKRKQGATPDSSSQDQSSGNADPEGQTDELPTWLNIYLCAALGSQTNVFRLQKNIRRHHVATGSRSSSVASPATSTVISIHPQASALVCRHVLDTLISLAKSFPNQFLPQLKSSETFDADDKDFDLDDKPKGRETPSKTPGAQFSPSKDSVNKSDASKVHTDFWDSLIKLDNMVGGKKGKGIQRAVSNVTVDMNMSATSYELSPLGQLMTMLAHPVVKKSQVLTDRLLRLLRLVSVGLPDITASSAQVPPTSSTAAAPATAPSTTAEENTMESTG